MPAAQAAPKSVPATFDYPNHVIFRAINCLEYAALLAEEIARQSIAPAVTPAHRVYQHAVTGAMSDIRSTIAEAQTLLMR
jgi:hypothetical protein